MLEGAEDEGTAPHAEEQPISLIDLDAATAFGKPAGMKLSTACSPPSPPQARGRS